MLQLHQTKFLLLFTAVVCWVFCFHSCWCVVPGISTCRISKPMLLSLEDHGTSERRYVAEHVCAITYAAFSPFDSNPGVFPPLCSHIAEQRVQNKTTCEWWSLSASKQTLVWSECLDSVHQTCCGFWVVRNTFVICKLLNLYAEW